MQKKIDYLIVGQGIAGTYLSAQLLEKNKSILVVDQGFNSSSSWVAAGVINPVVLKRLTLSWRAGEFMEYKDTFYSTLEARLGGKYHYPTPLFKLINSEDEKNFWSHRYHKADLENYLEESLLQVENLNMPLSKNFVLGKVKNSSWVDLKSLLKDFRDYLTQNDLLIEEQFNYDALNGNHYQGIDFDELVFCEGSAATKNPFSSELPFSLNKGELFEIESKEISLDEIVKKKVFLLPTQHSKFKVGATYAWKWEDEKPSEVKRRQLEEFLAEITPANYKIIAHESGVRPAVKDRRPLLGKLANSEYYIFNGLGSRGCLMAPLLSKELINHIENSTTLNPEVDIERFYKA